MLIRSYRRYQPVFLSNICAVVFIDLPEGVFDIDSRLIVKFLNGVIDGVNFRLLEFVPIQAKVNPDFPSKSVQKGKILIV